MKKRISAWRAVTHRYFPRQVPACIWCFYMVSLCICLTVPASSAVSLSKLAGFAFFHYSKGYEGQRGLFEMLWSFLSQGLILFLIPVPHIFLWALLAAVIRIIWQYCSADHSWSQQPSMRLLGGNDFTWSTEQKKKKKQLGFLEITKHPVFH